MNLSFLHIFAANVPCQPSGNSFLAFPTWYEYLKGTSVSIYNGPLTCSPQIQSLTDIWLIVAAVIEILLRVASIAAVAFIIYGGVQYMTSQGEPGKLTQARDTIVNALVGLAITIFAAVIVSFIAAGFH
jgi:lysylphosphatidylglycerol synthetase-like protein (DUF2156 family)